jgi:hypothetical protein
MKISHGFARLRILSMAGLVVIAGLLFVTPVRVSGQELPSPTAVASPKTYVSLQPVPRGREFDIAVVVGIMKGFHMNAHKLATAYLIPTTLTAKLPAGFKEIETSYPAGKVLNLSFSDTPLLVYTGSVTLRVKLAADSSAPLGAQTIPLALRYQACNDVACLPPVTIPVEAKLEVGPAGAKARATFPEIFSAPAPAKN